MSARLNLNGNVEAVERLAFMAALAVIEAPEREGTHSFRCGVRWGIIRDIRRELEAAGFDWRTACREVRDADRQARAEATRQRRIRAGEIKA